MLQTIPELYDLVEKYEPEIIWSDGQAHANSSYWGAEDFLAWYATNSTVNATAVWNDRWGHDTMVGRVLCVLRAMMMMKLLFVCQEFVC